MWFAAKYRAPHLRRRRRIPRSRTAVSSTTYLHPDRVQRVSTSRCYAGMCSTCPCHSQCTLILPLHHSTVHSHLLLAGKNTSQKHHRSGPHRAKETPSRRKTPPHRNTEPVACADKHRSGRPGANQNHSARETAASRIPQAEQKEREMQSARVAASPPLAVAQQSPPALEQPLVAVAAEVRVSGSVGAAPHKRRGVVAVGAVLLRGLVPQPGKREWALCGHGGGGGGGGRRRRGRGAEGHALFSLSGGVEGDDVRANWSDEGANTRMAGAGAGSGGGYILAAGASTRGRAPRLAVQGAQRHAMARCQRLVGPCSAHAC